MSKNPWDNLRQIFANDSNLDNIPAEAADNILIAWPVMLDFISRHAGVTDHKRALDYGCGGGRFAARLHTLGYTSFGIDSSRVLIQGATEHYGQYVTFEAGDEKIALQHEPFDIVTSIMTFEFIADIEKVLTVLVQTLGTGGLFVFAVHNPNYVRDSIASEGTPYVNFDSVTNPTQGILQFGNTNIPLFIRNSEQYRSILKPLGLQLLLESQPPFTQEFLSKYPISGPTKSSEYLILGFQKE